MKKFIVILSLASSVILLSACAKWTTGGNANLDAFAKCVTDAWVKMYGTETCSHCQNQKAIFGDSFQYINYVDCIKTPNSCQGIDRVPTWEFSDGTKEVGEKTFAELWAKSKCELVK